MVTVTGLVSRCCSFSFLSISLHLGTFLLSGRRCYSAAAKVFCYFSFRLVQSSSSLRAKSVTTVLYTFSLWRGVDVPRHCSTYENEIRGSVLGMRDQKELRSRMDHPGMCEPRIELLRVPTASAIIAFTGSINDSLYLKTMTTSWYNYCLVDSSIYIANRFEHRSTRFESSMKVLGSSFHKCIIKYARI